MAARAQIKAVWPMGCSRYAVRCDGEQGSGPVAGWPIMPMTRAGCYPVAATSSRSRSLLRKEGMEEKRASMEEAGGGRKGFAATRPSHLGELLLVESARDRHRGGWSEGCCYAGLPLQMGERRGRELVFQ